MKVVLNVEGEDIVVHKDETVRGEKYYSVVGVSSRKVIWGSSVEIVHKKVLKAIEKGEVDFSPVIKKKYEVGTSTLDDLPF